MIQTKGQWEKLDVPVLCRAASWFCYHSCTIIEAAQLDQRLRNDPSKPNFSNRHQFTPIPSSQQKARALWQGLCSVFPHWGVNVQEVQTSSSATLQQCSLKPELTPYFTPLMDAAACSVISTKAVGSLYLASAMQSSPGTATGLHQHQGEKSPLTLETFSHRLLFILTHWKFFIAALGFASPSEILHYIRAWVSNTPHSFQGKKHVLPTSASFPEKF